MAAIVRASPVNVSRCCGLIWACVEQDAAPALMALIANAAHANGARMRVCVLFDIGFSFRFGLLERQ
jgi:hypothetical protein